MVTYLAWGQEQDNFNPAVHCREDLKIFKLDITQNEGEVAVARAVVPEGSYIAETGMIAFISYQKKDVVVPLFKGRLVGVPIKMTPGLVFLEFVALPINAGDQITEAIKDLKQDSLYDPLLHDEQEQKDLSALLESKSMLCYWDRVSGERRFSDLFQGRQSLDLTAWVLEDSFKVSFIQMPLYEVHVTLSCEWIQSCWGELNLGPKLHHYFGRGLICTLTPEDLESRWPKAGMHLGRSGYEILESSLKRVPIKQHKDKQSLTSFTPSLKVNCEKTKTTKKIWLERAWYKARLLLGWHYQQKRQEVAQITMRQQTSLGQFCHKKNRVINLKLQNIMPSDNKGPVLMERFFDTPRGLKTIDYAIDIAKAHLAGSARCVEVVFQVPLERAFNITTDHNVILNGNWVPGGRIDAKVVAYGLCQEGLEAHAWIKLQASVGTEESGIYSTKQKNSTFSEVGVDHKMLESTQGISYALSIKESQEDPFAGLSDLSTENFIQELIIEGDAQQQFLGLKECEPVVESMRDYLKQNPTSFCMKLRDLRTPDVIERHYYIDVLNPWSAPKQVHYNLFKTN